MFRNMQVLTALLIGLAPVLSPCFKRLRRTCWHRGTHLGSGGR
jgi:hypothetical protein